ncbi:MAG: hypothetical protein L6V93_11185 [Clostridiales bacterium]|nr:MAG: hypothetical protein L6V93_11185 [Clostridiales bacterium]
MAYTVRTLCEIKKINEIIVAVPEEYLLYTSDFVKKTRTFKGEQKLFRAEKQDKNRIEVPL